MNGQRQSRANLLATKLCAPRARQNLVARPRLIARLDAGLRRPLTLVSAPAGFGKTTLVSAWVQGLAQPVAWLALEEADSDPAQFLRYFVAALQSIDAGIGRELLGALEASPRLDLAVGAIANELAARPEDFVLVLDDLHAIEDESIHAALRMLVVHPPPGMHLVVVTREDPPLPLARLRARDQLAELRAHDLRFTPEETAVFLNEVMGLALAARDVEELNARTEGWVAGLQLAGLSVRDRTDSTGFIAHLGGSHRPILNYLAEEVLSRQPEDVQRFLLHTAILDKLNGDLCDAVTGRGDSAAVLERLLGANLFLIPLDEERQWYRYHHLFAGALRGVQRGLGQEQVAALHRRASAWYAEAGMPGEAIGHALAAADYATALRLLESHATALVVQGHLKTVAGWLAAIPPELRARSPKTNMAFVWMHLVRGTLAEAAPYLDRLQALFSDSETIAGEDPLLAAEWLALQSSLMLLQGQPARSVELARRALDLAPEKDGSVRGLAYNGLACAYLLMGQYTRAVETYQQAIRHSRASAHFVTEILSISTLVQMSIHHGRLRFAYDVASQAAGRLEGANSLPPASAVVYGGLGQVHYHWNELGQARSQLQRAVRLCALGGYTDGETYHRALLSRVLLAAGDLEAAAGEIAAALVLMQSGAPEWVQVEVVAQQVRLALAEDRIAAAEAALERLGFTYGDGFSFPALDPDGNIAASFEETITHERGTLYNCALSVLLQREEARHHPGSLQLGVELAGRAVAGATRGEYVPVALEALLLRARLHAALGRRADARADCAAALELGEPDGFIRLFVESGAGVAGLLASVLQSGWQGPARGAYAERLLAALPGAPADRPLAAGWSGPAETGEPAGPLEALSSRELEVLRLIDAGLSNREIAARLVLSIHTVKKHTGSIFAKLGVASRTQALARARRWRLLAE